MNKKEMACEKEKKTPNLELGALRAFCPLESDEEVTDMLNNIKDKRVARILVAARSIYLKNKHLLENQCQSSATSVTATTTAEPLALTKKSENDSSKKSSAWELYKAYKQKRLTELASKAKDEEARQKIEMLNSGKNAHELNKIEENTIGSVNLIDLPTVIQEMVNKQLEKAPKKTTKIVELEREETTLGSSVTTAAGSKRTGRTSSGVQVTERPSMHTKQPDASSSNEEYRQMSCSNAQRRQKAKERDEQLGEDITVASTSTSHSSTSSSDSSDEKEIDHGAKSDRPIARRKVFGQENNKVLIEFIEKEFNYKVPSMQFCRGNVQLPNPDIGWQLRKICLEEGCYYSERVDSGNMAAHYKSRHPQVKNFDSPGVWVYLTDKQNTERKMMFAEASAALAAIKRLERKGIVERTESPIESNKWSPKMQNRYYRLKTKNLREKIKQLKKAEKIRSKKDREE